MPTPQTPTSLTDFRAEIVVQLRSSVLDPAGTAVRSGLQQMGYDTVSQVRIGKHIIVDLQAPSAEAAEQQLAQMCEALLTNPVIETYTLTLTALTPA